MKKRNDLEKLKWVDVLLKKHEQYLDLLKKEQELRHRRNVISDEVRQLKKKGKDIKEKIKEAKELPDKVKELTEKVEKLKTYAEELKKELAAVEEHITELSK